MGMEGAEEGRAGGGRAAMRVVIAGAGPAAVETLLGLRHLAGDRVEIEVVAPSDELRYWPVLVLEPFTAVPSEGVSLEVLFRRHRVRFRRDFLASVDAEAHTARTGGGDEVGYDALVVACGATHVEGVPGAVTVPSVGDVEEIKALLDDLATGRVRRAAFALPLGAGWPLPLYELVLMTASEIQRRGRRDAELLLVTPESDPLGLFGKSASESVRELLEASGVEIVTQTYPIAVEEGGLAVRPGGLLTVDRVVALSRVEGPRIGGVSQDANGFIPVDPQGAVVGASDVYAAGDAVAFPLKQGGIATQQAAAVAESIAARAGAPITPRPFRPVLNGLLLTGGQPRYLRSELTGGYGTSSLLSLEPLWWPPAKIAGRHLGPALAELTGTPIPEPPADAVAVDVELEVDRVAGL